MGTQPLLNRRYKIVEQLGAGGTALVFKAQDLSLSRVVAVKVLRESLTSDSEFLNRFQQEARAAANLTHPNIVTIHDFGIDGRLYYIVMEYIDGKDLKSIVREKPNGLTIDKALTYGIQMCAGIGYAHRAGLVHCDVKPQNILVTPEGRIKVTDFGIARALATIHPQENNEIVWGSPQYFSPEQAAGEAPTPASDVYSIGVTLYEMLTGRLPFTAQDPQQLALMHLRDQPPALSMYNPRIPTALERIVLKVLAKEPSARYRTADQLGHILISFREQGAALTGTQRPTPRSGGASSQAQTRPAASLAQPPLASTQMRPVSASGGYAQAPAPAYTASQPQAAIRPEYVYEANNEPDWLGIILGIIAVVAVVGLIPLWLIVFSRYNPGFFG